MAGRPVTANVRCPACDYAYSKQTRSNVTPDGYMRKRTCLSSACGKKFMTYEIHARQIKVLRAIRKVHDEEANEAKRSEVCAFVRDRKEADA